MSMIDHFDTYWLALSNFAAAPLIWKGEFYPTSEHAYQAEKVTDPVKKALVRDARTPNLAKTLGQKYKDRADWDDVKLKIMEEIVSAKFEQNSDLAEILLATGNADLAEGNRWGDRFWGVYLGGGANHLGKILMAERERLRRKRQKGGFPILGAQLVSALEGLPMDLLKVYEKIGEELGELQDEISGEKNFENLLEEACDLLVTSTAAVECVRRTLGSEVKDLPLVYVAEGPLGTGLQAEVNALAHNPFDILSAQLPRFVSLYGRYAKAQRKWRGADTEETRKALSTGAIALARQAFVMASSLAAEDKVLEIYMRKVLKWRGYAKK